MSEKIELKIYDLVGGPIWVSTEDGQRVFEKITAAFDAGRAVALSFANRQIMITAFLNAAVGQLYNGKHSDDFLRENLSPVDIDPDDLATLKRTVENAKAYFRDPKRFDQTAREEMGDEE